MKTGWLSIAVLSWVGLALGAETIPIGHINSMSGPEASFGIGSNRGVQLAVKEVNETGGIRGKLVKLYSLDDQGRSDEAVTAITKVITHHKVVAIVGEAASSRMLAMAPIAQQYKV